MLWVIVTDLLTNATKFSQKNDRTFIFFSSGFASHCSALGDGPIRPMLTTPEGQA